MSKVRLISKSEIMCDELRAVTGGTVEGLLAYCARVSSPANQTAGKDPQALINYLIEHEHWSPFEMVSFCLEIETTRDIARQILRHRSFSFQEFSQRYAAVDRPGTVPLRECRLQDPTNRQNSTPNTDLGLTLAWELKQLAVFDEVYDAYEWALSQGIAKEVARAILPEGLTVTRMYMSGTLRSWIHYIKIRSGVETQKEHREIARQCAAVIEPHFPMIGVFK